MRLPKLAMAAAAVVLAVPAMAEPSEMDVASFVRSIGNSTAGLKVGGGAAADKLVSFAESKGELVVTGIAAEPPDSATRPNLDPNMIGMIRTRASNMAGKQSPDALDLAFAQADNRPVFIVGEWNKPPVIWEIAVNEGTARWRVIDNDGKPGPWRNLADQTDEAK